jgi:hypothetical protein
MSGISTLKEKLVENKQLPVNKNVLEISEQ